MKNDIDHTYSNVLAESAGECVSLAPFCPRLRTKCRQAQNVVDFMIFLLDRVNIIIRLLNLHNKSKTANNCSHVTLK